MSWFRWFRPNVRDRLAPYNLRPDVLAAASAMASDQRSDVYVAKLQSSLTDSETVLRMMDARYAREMGLLVLTSERILFRSRRSGGATAFSVLLHDIVAIEAYTRKVSGTVRLTTRKAASPSTRSSAPRVRCSPTRPRRRSAVGLGQNGTRWKY